MKVLADLVAHAARLDAPIAVHWTLTHACNLSCAHCFQPSHRKGADELTRTEAMRILGELADAGVLFLTFSGGEVFARADFLELVAEARRLRFAVSVYTNGTLLDEARARALAENGVLRVEVSLHAAEASAHDAFVGRGGAFAGTRKAVELLARRGVQVVVKTSLTGSNVGDCERIQGLFAHLPTVATSSDAVLFPRDDGDHAPVALVAPIERRRELAARAAAAIADADLARMAARLDTDGARRSPATCAAGRASLAIQPNGDVTPCTIWSRPLGSLRTNSFLALWRGAERAQARRATVQAFLESTPECGRCSYGAVCSFCPALSLRETGRETGRSPQVCERTTLRWGAVEERMGRTPRPPPPARHGLRVISAP